MSQNLEAGSQGFWPKVTLRSGIFLLWLPSIFGLQQATGNYIIPNAPYFENVICSCWVAPHPRVTRERKMVARSPMLLWAGWRRTLVANGLYRENMFLLVRKMRHFNHEAKLVIVKTYSGYIGRLNRHVFWFQTMILPCFWVFYYDVFLWNCFKQA